MFDQSDVNRATSRKLTIDQLKLQLRLGSLNFNQVRLMAHLGCESAIALTSSEVKRFVNPDRSVYIHVFDACDWGEAVHEMVTRAFATKLRQELARQFDIIERTGPEFTSQARKIQAEISAISMGEELVSTHEISELHASLLEFEDQFWTLASNPDARISWGERSSMLDLLSACVLVINAELNLKRYFTQFAPLNHSYSPQNRPDLLARAALKLASFLRLSFLPFCNWLQTQILESIQAENCDRFDVTQFNSQARQDNLRQSMDEQRAEPSKLFSNREDWIIYLNDRTPIRVDHWPLSLKRIAGAWSRKGDVVDLRFHVDPEDSSPHITIRTTYLHTDGYQTDFRVVGPYARTLRPQTIRAFILFTDFVLNTPEAQIRGYEFTGQVPIKIALPDSDTRFLCLDDAEFAKVLIQHKLISEISLDQNCKNDKIQSAITDFLEWYRTFESDFKLPEIRQLD